MSPAVKQPSAECNSIANVDLSNPFSSVDSRYPPARQLSVISRHSFLRASSLSYSVYLNTGRLRNRLPPLTSFSPACGQSRNTYECMLDATNLMA